MAIISWTAPVSGDWRTAANWTPATVPNGAAADVVIDVPTTIAQGYTVTLPAGVTETVNSLSMNAVNNRVATWTPDYKAASLELDGTLAFAPGSAGLIDGPLQTYIHTAPGTNAEILNGGTINGFLWVEGNLLMTGTNDVYITMWVKAQSGTVTIDSKIGELSGNVLFDGLFEAYGTGATVNLGGPLQNQIINIGTIEGPPQLPFGYWTEVIFNDPTAKVQEWDGTKYVSLETTLTEIAARGTVDVLEGRNYTTTNTLTVDTSGLLNLQAGTVTTGGLTINGGIVEGFAVINSNVVNNGTLIAHNGSIGGKPVTGVLDVLGSLSGTGVVVFDQGTSAFDGGLAASTTGATLEVHAVSAGQTIVMTGKDTLRLDAPSAFAGTIVAQAGDKIVLSGVSATDAVMNGGTLVVSNGSTVVDRLAVAGPAAGKAFTVSGSTITVGTEAAAQTNFAVLATSTNTPLNDTGTAYTGPVAGLNWQYLNLSPINLNVASNVPNAFIHSGSGQDALDVSHANGTNVLDGGTGSNFLVGGTGNDTFFLDDRNPPGALWSTLVNFHSGDNATVWGLTAADFQIQTLDNQGAAGFTGLTFNFTKAGQPTASLTLTGFNSADLSNGRLSLSYGRTDDLPGLPGSSYLSIHGA